MMALIIADQQGVTLTVDLDALVCTEQLWADRFHWSVHANASDLTSEPTQMLSTEEQALTEKKMKDQE